MNFFTVPYLLSKLNEVVKRTDQNSMEDSVVRKCRAVLYDIGYEAVCDIKIIEVPVKQGRWQIPKEVVEIIHVGDNRNCFGSNYYITSNAHFYSLLVYTKTPFELIFNPEYDGSVFVSAYFFYKDEDGNLMIPELAYEACFQSCLAEQIENLQNPKHPMWQRIPFIEQKAAFVTGKARADFKKLSMDQYRTYKRIY